MSLYLPSFLPVIQWRGKEVILWIVKSWLITSFSASENAKMSFEESQSKIEQFLEDYCAAYGFVMSRNESFIQELIQRGE